MKRSCKKTVFIFPVVLFLLFGAAVPGYSRDFTIDELRQAAVENSRKLETLELVIKQSGCYENIYENEFEKMRTEVMAQSGVAVASKGKATLASDDAAVAAVMSDPSATANERVLAYSIMINDAVTSSILSSSATLDFDIIEGDLSILKIYGLSGTDDIVLELKDKKEDQEDMTEDLREMLGESSEQVSHMAAFLGLKYLELEESISVLEDAYGLYLQLAETERIKEANGLGTTYGSEQAGFEAAEYKRQLDFAQDNLAVLEINIRQLTGLPEDEELVIAPFSPGMTDIPLDAAQTLYEDVLEDIYEFRTLEREIKNLEKDIDRSESSNEKAIMEKEIEKIELEMKDLEEDTKAKVQKMAASYNSSSYNYKVSSMELRSEEKNCGWEEMREKAGLISPLMLRADEVSLHKEKLNNLKALYAFYLDSEEIRMAREGIIMSDEYYEIKQG